MIRILIPVYNEEKNIQDCVLNTRKFLKRKPHRFYLVNDGSKDHSLEILNKLAKKNPVQVLDHKVNKGVAAALKTGLTQIVKDGQDSDVVVVMEGDGTSNPKLLPKMISEIQNGKDVVIASRYVKGGRYHKFPTKRLFLSKSANNLLKFLFPYPGLQDYTHFYRAYSLWVIKKAMKVHGKNLITTKYFTANTEFLMKILTSSVIISELPFVYDYSRKKGKSGLRIGKNLKQYFKLIFEQKIMRVR
ncbi:MAG: glycosyltransferase family 2 protein [Patescibacteria group bacterium]